MKVALGAAKGLAYLHSAEAKVIYRDFKTSNVLLDSVRHSITQNILFSSGCTISCLPPRMTFGKQQKIFNEKPFIIIEGVEFWNSHNRVDECL